MGDFAKYMGFAFLLILIFLVVSNWQGASKIINSLSSANTNAILALQGRNPTSAFG